jgi:hypothetical protein
LQHAASAADAISSAAFCDIMRSLITACAPALDGNIARVAANTNHFMLVVTRSFGFKQHETGQPRLENPQSGRADDRNSSELFFLFVLFYASCITRPPVIRFCVI